MLTAINLNKCHDDNTLFYICSKLKARELTELNYIGKKIGIRIPKCNKTHLELYSLSAKFK